MPSPLKQIHTQSFAGGRNSDLAPEFLPNDTYRRMQNCNVLSTPDGNVDIVTNVKGNTAIHVDLPPGTNKTIGVALDEENNRMYYAVWNSEGYHSWFRYDYVTNRVSRVLQCITDTNEQDIFRWGPDDYIFHADVIGGDLLYWTMAGHPPRKINIRKAMDKSGFGYGADISEEFTRAYKRAGIYAPQVEYFTDEGKKFNLLYRRQFKFAYRWIYDDNEKSDWSEWSSVPNPVFESFIGEKTIPIENNGIKVFIETGSSIVVGIELAMQTILEDGSLSLWRLVDSLNKDHLGISDDDRYEYRFYNEGSYTPIDQSKIIRNYSFIPRDPACQSFTKNAIVYSNFTEGFDPVDVDVDWSVEYEDVYFDEPDTGENNPELIYNFIRREDDKGRHATIGEFIVGPDVKMGNVFEVVFFSVGTILSTKVKHGQVIRQTLRVVATANDDARTVASKLANQLRTIQTGTSDHHKKSYVRDVVSYGGGSYGFEWRHRTSYMATHWAVTVTATPIDVVTIEDNGQSVRVIKNGSSTKYGIVYYDDDGRKSSVYSNDGLIVSVDTPNELGAIKSPVVKFRINHAPPYWAKYYSIVRTRDLTFDNYIYMYLQKVAEIVHDSGEEYYNISIGSLYTYQRVHPNSTLRYDFRAGDRLRVIYAPDNGGHKIVEDYRDFEILSYSPEVVEIMDQDIEIDGSAIVKVDTASDDHIGSFIRVDGSEREIIAVVDGTTYELERPIATGNEHSSRKYPSYEIVNKRGVLRVAKDPDHPISSGSVAMIFSPATQGQSDNDDMFHEFNKKFNIIGSGTANAAHEGNVQNQDASNPAIVAVTEGTAYVRQRAFPVNNSEYNTQVEVFLIEDSSYSDFYYSNMTDDGKANALDTGQGVVHFDSRARWSNNFVEGTRINGLNDFDNLDREDYNDQYGAIVRTIFANGRLFVFKHLKCSYATVYANRITQADGSEILATTDRLLPRMLEYFLWDGGLGSNPGGVTRHGNNFFFVSPDSGIAGMISYNGVEPISFTYSLDKVIREKISAAKTSGARMLAWYDRKNGNYELTFGPHDNIIFSGDFVQSDWDSIDDVPQILGKVFFGSSLIGSLPTAQEIESAPSISFSEDGFTIPFTDDGTPKYYWVAYMSSSDSMNVWRDPANPMNIGDIGGQGGLFRQFQNVGPYKVIITRYPTQMTNMRFEP